jgi:hypothetical protein
MVMPQPASFAATAGSNTAAQLSIVRVPSAFSTMSGL